MSIATEIDRIKTNIANAYTAIQGKGGTLPTTADSAHLSDAIVTIPAQEVRSGATVEQFIGPTVNGALLPPENPFDIDWSGITQINTNATTGLYAYKILTTEDITIPDVETIEPKGCVNMFTNAQGINYVSWNKLRHIEADGMRSAFTGSGVAAVFMGQLQQVDNNGLDFGFQGCDSLEEVDLGQLQIVRNWGLRQAFAGTSSLTGTLDLSNLHTTGSQALIGLLKGSAIEEIDLSNLGRPASSTVNKYTFGTNLDNYAFNEAEALTKIILPEAGRAKIEATVGYASKWGAPETCEIEWV